jgi:predicted SAM-dependent methyltransferase
MKSVVKAISRRLGVYNQISRLWIWLNPIITRGTRAVTAGDRALIDRYLASQPVARLHIGCGDHELPEWLNTDLNPKPNQLYLNATQTFPLPDNAFDYIYSEHVIEHVTLPQGRVMLAECLRVLRPNGVLRIVTPDLLKLTSLLADTLTSQQRGYVEYSIKQYGIAGSPPRGSHVLNHFVRSWGHTFIYDAETLVDQFRGAGFTDVIVCSFNQSVHAALHNLAHVRRMPPGLLDYESLTVEGRKPAA